MKINKKLIEELTKYLKEFGLSELEYSDNETKIKVSKNSISNKIVKSSEETIAIKNIENDTGHKIKSPIIGTSYLAPEPGAKKFVEIGKKLKRVILL